jgi:DNA ligase-1
MKRFIQLFLELDSTNKTSRKETALISYFQDAPPRDAAWVVTYLIGKRPPTAITAKHVRVAAI